MPAGGPVTGTRHHFGRAIRPMADHLVDDTDATSETTRRVLAISQDVRDAIFDVARSAKRSLAIFTHDLEPEIYNRIEFLDIIKNLILTHRFAKVRILLMDPLQSVREGHRLIELARRFSTFFELRLVHPDYKQHTEAFLIADQAGLVYRINATRWEGIADVNTPRIACRYLDFFDGVWEKSEVVQETRRLHL